ncbi:MAG TPA: glycosyltransferase [Anaerolineales bacterium]|nr:glycosyltransferase [Anaerolineales bacterium]
MRIACISASTVPSNTANSIQVMKACQALAQLGHEVQLFVPKMGPGTATAEPLQAHYGLQTGFPVEWLPANLRLHRYDLGWRAVRRARSWQADLIYTWLPQAALSGRLHGFPLVMELHGPPEGRFGPALFHLMWDLPGKLRLMPITQALADLLSQSGLPLSTADGRISTVISPNGIDLERFTNLPEPEEARRQLGLPEKPTAGYTGHLYAGRGMTLLTELARHLPQVQFLWAGGREAEVRAWQERLKAEGLTNVHLTGFIENRQLPLYQAAAEVLLMPYERAISGSSGGNSAGYASPMKMFEYMACRRAILSSDLPVIREVLNETNAVLCPPEDGVAWTEALSALLADEAKRKALATQAWQDVQPYSWLERARRGLVGFPNP